MYIAFVLCFIFHKLSHKKRILNLLYVLFFINYLIFNVTNAHVNLEYLKKNTHGPFLKILMENDESLLKNFFFFKNLNYLSFYSKLF